jgi:hypothetical protein
MKLSPITLGQRLGWYWASIVYGICVVIIASSSHDSLSVLWEFEPLVPYGVFVAMWLVGVGLMRIYLQDKDPTDIAHLLGLKKRSSEGPRPPEDGESME